MGRFDDIIWTGKVQTGIGDEESLISIIRLDSPIDWWEAELDENGNMIYASQSLEEKFIEAGWKKNYARFDGIRLIKLTEDAADYATSDRKTGWFAKNDDNGTSFLGLAAEVDQRRLNNESQIVNKKSIRTRYEGHNFESRQEARWYIAFKTWGADLEYEPEGYDLGNGIWYLPDFLIHDVIVVCHPDDYPESWHDHYYPQDIYFEVKGQMTKEDSEKIRRLYKSGEKILPIGHIPEGNTFKEICDNISNQYCKGVTTFNGTIPVFDPAYVGIDTHTLVPCALKNHSSGIFGLVDPIYPECLRQVDFEKTMEGYRKARQAKFEHGYTNNN